MCLLSMPDASCRRCKHVSISIFAVLQRPALVAQIAVQLPLLHACTCVAHVLHSSMFTLLGDIGTGATLARTFLTLEQGLTLDQILLPLHGCCSILARRNALRFFCEKGISTVKSRLT